MTQYVIKKEEYLTFYNHVNDRNPDEVMTEEK
jgi:hypothetical protein